MASGHFSTIQLNEELPPTYDGIATHRRGRFSDVWLDAARRHYDDLLRAGEGELEMRERVGHGRSLRGLFAPSLE